MVEDGAGSPQAPLSVSTLPSPPHLNSTGWAETWWRRNKCCCPEEIVLLINSYNWTLKRSQTPRLELSGFFFISWVSLENFLWQPRRGNAARRQNRQWSKKGQDHLKHRCLLVRSPVPLTSIVQGEPKNDKGETNVVAQRKLYCWQILSNELWKDLRLRSRLMILAVF